MPEGKPGGPEGAAPIPVGFPDGASGTPGAPDGAEPAGRFAPGKLSTGGGNADVQSTIPSVSTPRRRTRANVSANAWFQVLVCVSYFLISYKKGKGEKGEREKKLTPVVLQTT